jgi:phosphatidylserine decarboxylase
MTFRHALQRLLAQEDLNFLLTNRLPRQALTRFMGWWSKIEQPLVRSASIAIWKFFGDLDLRDAKKQRFTSMHDCFTRELRDGARTVDPGADVLCSPVDAIVGESGPVRGTQVFQAKGFPYTLQDLIGPDEDVEPWRDGTYVTLRLTSGMYHRFHAPYACTVEKVRYFSGDTWTVNPVALKRVEKLVCKNERAFLGTRLRGGAADGQRVALVPVAAILVASIRLHFLDVLFHLKYHGPQAIACNAALDKGQEMGWFQHGSTVIVLAAQGFQLCDGLAPGTRIRMGQALLQWRG